MIGITNRQSLAKPVLAKILFLMLALALIVSVGVAQVEAKASTFTTDYRTDLQLRLFVPCAAAGAGEFVQVSGPLHIVFVTTLDKQSGFKSKYGFQTKGVTGIGLSSGVTYQGKGEPHGTFRGTVGTTSNFVDSFKMNGSGGSFLIRANVHFSVNARGAMTVSADNFSVTCKHSSYPSYPG